MASGIQALLLVVLFAATVTGQPVPYVLSWTTFTPPGYTMASLADFNSAAFQEAYAENGYLEYVYSSIGPASCVISVLEGVLNVATPPDDNTYFYAVCEYNAPTCSSSLTATVQLMTYESYDFSEGTCLTSTVPSAVIGSANFSTIATYALFKLNATVDCVSLTPQGCDACTSQSGCGWCETAGRCAPGNANGPTSGSCPNWEYGGCSDCVAYSSCVSCLSDLDCGWCVTNNACLPGNITAPYYQQCASWDYFQCPTSN